jgi:hypothetical protein
MTVMDINYLTTNRTHQNTQQIYLLKTIHIKIKMKINLHPKTYPYLFFTCLFITKHDSSS